MRRVTFCLVCGAESPAEAERCFACGAPLHARAGRAVPRLRRRHGVPWLWILVLLAVAAVLALLFVLLLEEPVTVGEARAAGLHDRGEHAPQVAAADLADRAVVEPLA